MFYTVLAYMPFLTGYEDFNLIPAATTKRTM
jgi:hypothetical protein